MRIFHGINLNKEEETKEESCCFMREKKGL